MTSQTSVSSPLNPGARTSPSNRSCLLLPSHPPASLPASPDSSLNFEFIVLLLLFQKGFSPFHIFLNNILFSFGFELYKNGSYLFLSSRSHISLWYFIVWIVLFCLFFWSKTWIVCRFFATTAHSSGVHSCTYFLLYISVSLGFKT